MAARPIVNEENQTLHTFTVKAASSVTEGYPVKIDSSTGNVLNCTAGDACDGYAKASASAAALVEIALADGGGIVKAKVGTGGATAGAWLKAANDGVTDAGTLGGGSTLINIVGKALQTGVAGDFIGVLPISFAAVKA